MKSQPPEAHAVALGIFVRYTAAVNGRARSMRLRSRGGVECDDQPGMRRPETKLCCDLLSFRSRTPGPPPLSSMDSPG
jgi:hypothetical protein